MAKKLESIIKSQIILLNNHSLKSSVDFVLKTKYVVLKKHQTLLSFDITNLYTNIPIKETLELLRPNLNADSSLSREAISELMILTSKVLNQNYFALNNVFYQQENGLAMGFPLSGLLSEIYLNKFENTAIFSDKNKQKDKLVFYHRYVDDTILLFNGNTWQIGMFHNYLNSITPLIKFSLDVESRFGRFDSEDFYFIAKDTMSVHK